MAIANITNNILTDSGVATSSLLPLTGGTLTGALNINLSSGTAMNVAGNAIFRGDTGVGTPRQLIITSGGSTPVYLEAKGYGANYQTDFGIRTFNSVGTSFEVFYATSSGLVGINQTSPAYLLDVNGTFGATSAFLSSYIRTDGSAGFKNTSSGGTAPSSLASYSQLFFDSYSLMVRKADGQINTFRYPNVASTQTWDFNVEGYLTAQSTASLTTGSVMFANSVGKITQDNAQFFWDDTNNRLGIGTSGPSQKLEVAGADVKILINSSDYAALQLKAGSVRTFNIVAKNDGTGLLSIYDATAAADRLTIASTGAATFSSSVSLTDELIFSGAAVNTSIKTFGSGDRDRLRIRAYNEVNLNSDTLLTFNTGGSERMRITSDGNLLLGTTDNGSGAKLVFYSTTAAQQLKAAGTAPAITFSNTITSPTIGGVLGAATSANQFITGTASGDMVLANQFNTGALIFGTSNTERARITSGGNVLIGATSTGAYFDGIFNAFGSGTTPAACFKNDGTSGQITSSFWNALGSGDNIFMDFVTETSYTKRGSISFNRSAGLVVYNTTSDYRLKSEISDFNALNIIDNLKPKEFRIGDAVNKSIGFIAHELQEYLPQAVSGKKDAIDKDGNPIYQSVDYSQLTGLLVKAIQELKAEIETLKIK
jgi:hypothetical protein